MREIRERNVHQAFPVALNLLRKEGRKRDSRNGPVLVMDEPVITVYEEPCERVLFHTWRNANPFLHFAEMLWMLAGRNDVAFLTRYAARFGQFSDDGKIFNAAYGHRWRFMQLDQLPIIADLLKKNRDTRQAALQIWNSYYDLGTETKDHACNLMATFQCDRHGRVCMTVFCRSNDIVWGCYGANAVHFSALLEYIAGRAGRPVGTYTHMSVNWHGYENLYPLESYFEHASDGEPDPYEFDNIYPVPFGPVDNNWDVWDAECKAFCTLDGKAPLDSLIKSFKNQWFRHVAWPIFKAHDYYKDEKDFETAHSAIELCQAHDWKIACQEWLQRREAAYNRAKEDGAYV